MDEALEPHDGTVQDESETVSEPGKRLPNKFSSTNQPTKEARRIAQGKRAFTREVMKELVNMVMKFPNDSKLKQALTDAYGKSAVKRSAGELMTLVQIQKAVLTGDTNAYNAVMNQTFGAPAASDPNEEDGGISNITLVVNMPDGMDYQLPSNIEDEQPDDKKTTL